MFSGNFEYPNNPFTMFTPKTKRSQKNVTVIFRPKFFQHSENSKNIKIETARAVLFEAVKSR